MILTTQFAYNDRQLVSPAEIAKYGGVFCTVLARAVLAAHLSQCHSELAWVRRARHHHLTEMAHLLDTMGLRGFQEPPCDKMYPWGHNPDSIRLGLLERARAIFNGELRLEVTS